MAKSVQKRKRNPQDATLRNVRAAARQRAAVVQLCAKQAERLQYFGGVVRQLRLEVDRLIDTLDAKASAYADLSEKVLTLWQAHQGAAPVSFAESQSQRASLRGAATTVVGGASDGTAKR